MVRRFISVSVAVYSIFSAISATAQGFDSEYRSCVATAELSYQVTIENAGGNPDAIAGAKAQLAIDKAKCLNEYLDRQKQATFSPEPNDPPRRTGGSGTRMISDNGTIVSDPSKCPAGTNVVLPNGDGTYTCFTIPETKLVSVTPAAGCKIIGWRPGPDGKPVPIIDCQGFVLPSVLQLSQIEPPPGSPAPRTTVSGGGNA